MKSPQFFSGKEHTWYIYVCIATVSTSSWPSKLKRELRTKSEAHIYMYLYLRSSHYPVSLSLLQIESCLHECACPPQRRNALLALWLWPTKAKEVTFLTWLPKRPCITPCLLFAILVCNVLPWHVHSCIVENGFTPLPPWHAHEFFVALVLRTEDL